MSYALQSLTEQVKKKGHYQSWYTNEAIKKRHGETRELVFLALEKLICTEYRNEAIDAEAQTALYACRQQVHLYLSWAYEDPVARLGASVQKWAEDVMGAAIEIDRLLRERHALRMLEDDALAVAALEDDEEDEGEYWNNALDLYNLVYDNDRYRSMLATLSPACKDLATDLAIEACGYAVRYGAVETVADVEYISKRLRDKIQRLIEDDVYPRQEHATWRDYTVAAAVIKDYIQEFSVAITKRTGYLFDIPF